MTQCPNCGSDRFRRGGMKTWGIYLLLILFAVVATMAFELHAGIVAGVVIAGAVLANLLFNERVCLDCGTQWDGSGSSGSSGASGSSAVGPFSPRNPEEPEEPEEQKNRQG